VDWFTEDRSSTTVGGGAARQVSNMMSGGARDIARRNAVALTAKVTPAAAANAMMTASAATQNPMNRAQESSFNMVSTLFRVVP
jgi:hypothetical protein